MAKARSKSASPPPAETPDQPYYLQKARVKDYRSVRDAEVEFKPGLNIIIGPNGSGKTNFLRAVEAGLALKEKNVASVGTSFRIGGATRIDVSYVRPASKPDERRFPFGGLTASFRINVSADGLQTQVDALREAWNDLPALRESEFGLGYDLVLLRHGLPGSEELALLDEPPSLHFNPRRALGYYLPRHLFPILWGVNSSFARHPKQKTDAVAVLTKIFQRVVRLYAERLTEFLLRYTPVRAARLSDQFKVYFNEVNDEFSVHSLYLEYESNGGWRRFSELSDGAQRLIYLVSQFVAPMFFQAKSASTFYTIERSNIFLLEEPELGIHPHQLHKLLELIREVSEKHQVILTTHSPQVLDLLREDELDRILICELTDPKKGTQFRRLTKKQQEKARRYMNEIGFLSDYWRYSKLEEDAR